MARRQLPGMDTRVSKLANIVDDKTIIAKLILEKSDRIRLIEFKDARADIWQFFRLVCLDGITLPYAVCVRCMKPVSYKAREGTGGLHRHPCSKHAIAAAMAAGIPFGSSTGRSTKVSQMNRSSTSKTSTLPTPASSSAVVPSKMVSNFKPNFTFNSLAAIEMVNNLAKNSRNLAQNLITGTAFAQQSFDSHPTHLASIADQMEGNVFNEDIVTLNIVKLFCTELIPLELLENGPFVDLIQKLVNFGAINGSINLDRIQVNSLLTTAFETSRLEFTSVIKSAPFVTFVVDLWSQEITRRQMMTVWAHLSAHIGHQTRTLCKIVVTKDISHISCFAQLIKRLDSIRKDITNSESEFVYLFDNEFNRLDIEANDNFVFCVSHQLNEVLNEMHSIADFKQMFNEVKAIMNVMEDMDGLGLKCVSQSVSNFNNWFQLIKIFQTSKRISKFESNIGRRRIKICWQTIF